MAGTALRRRLTWQVARVSAVSDETASVRTIMLDVPDWPGHQAGQHLGIRLTDEDGYVAERSYSIASAPGEPVAITVERLDDGEVSPYLTDELRVGDDLEMRGPIGGYFIWEPEDGGPLLLLAGGSGGGGGAAAVYPPVPRAHRQCRLDSAAVLVADAGRCNLLG
jgi:ferredoxin-NADP reductase